MDELHKRLADVLKGYETWEANMILDQKAWNGGLAELPTLTYPLWDQLMDLQRQRNQVLLDFQTKGGEFMATETKVKESRLWGTWQPAFYPSGTTIVIQSEVAHKPHLYVYADSAVDEDRYMRDRYAMCHQLADYMNGGAKPAWLDDMIRRSESHCESLTGASITATGPSIDRDPPNLFWVEDDSDEAKNDRALLMDRLFGIEPKSVTRSKCQ